MSLTREDLIAALSRKIANTAKARVRRRTESRTLRDALRIERTRGKWFIGVPHYWAVYYHDDRRAASSSREGGFLIWYKNPKDDPRHGGIFPQRASQLRSLRHVNISPERLRADLESGRAVISRTSPRSGGSVAGHPFFKKGLTNYFVAGGGNEVGQNEWRRLMLIEIPRAFKQTKIVRTFVI